MHEDNTPQELGRTETIKRDAAWEAAYLAQLTDALAASVGAFAKKRASWLEGKTKRKDNYLWRELLQARQESTGLAVWPFEGSLDIRDQRGLVIAEMYPRAAYGTALSDVLPAKPVR